MSFNILKRMRKLVKPASLKADFCNPIKSIHLGDFVIQKVKILLWNCFPSFGWVLFILRWPSHDSFHMNTLIAMMGTDDWMLHGCTKERMGNFEKLISLQVWANIYLFSLIFRVSPSVFNRYLQYLVSFAITVFHSFPKITFDTLDALSDRGGTIRTEKKTIFLRKRKKYSKNISFPQKTILNTSRHKCWKQTGKKRISFEGKKRVFCYKKTSKVINIILNDTRFSYTLETLIFTTALGS